MPFRNVLSQTLGSIAQRLNEPQPYEHIHFHDQGSPNYERNVIEVLLMSPRLAQGVEKVRINGMCIAPEDVRNILHNYAGLSQDDLEKIRREIDLRYILVRRLLAKTNRIQRLEVGAHHMIESGNDSIARLVPLPTFKHLRTIWLRRFNYTGQEHAHAALLHTLAKLPKLEHIDLHSMSDLQLPEVLPVFNTLRAISTASPGMTKATLHNLVKCCPHLQEFTYIATASDKVDSPRASARAVIDALAVHKDTIREISIHYTSYHCIDPDAPEQYPNDYQEIIPPLTQFVRLRRLSCDAIDLFDCPSDGDRSTPPTFIHKLPKSLEELKIKSLRRGDEVELKILAKTGAQVLPALQTLIIGSSIFGGGHVPPGVRAAFDKSYIELVVLD